MLHYLILDFGVAIVHITKNASEKKRQKKNSLSF